MSKIKSIMIIHIAKTRAQVKSIALISIGPNVRMKTKQNKKRRANEPDEAVLPSCPGDNSFTVIASENDSMCMYHC